jgi:predicted alpha/beta-hydrolase family hydrolase
MTERGTAFLLAPGAGAPSSHPRMQTFARLLASIGAVTTLDYPYALAGRKRPDPAPMLIAAHKAALTRLRQDRQGPIVLIGKSMGGRVGCHLALVEPVEAVICLGYPLCGAGDRSNLRDKVLLELRTPTLFVQGTRDPLCPLDLLEEVRGRMHAPTALHVVEGGDHSLGVSKTALKAQGATQEQADAQILAAISSFLNGLSPKGTLPRPQSG